jgi:Protein of unknown function (DUF2934)
MLDATIPLTAHDHSEHFEVPRHSNHQVSAPAGSHDTMEPSHDAIAQEAYALYAARGYQDGWHVQDWLAAEEALRHRHPNHEY